MSSSSSTELDLAIGDVVEGFRIERLPAPGDRPRVWEATQLSLERRVALTFIPATDFVRSSIAGDRVLAVRETRHGLLVATRLERGDSESVAPRVWGRSRSRWALVGVCIVAVAAVVALVVQGSGSGARVVPTVRPGTIALGSALRPGPAPSVDCLGQALTGSSPACTLVQTTLGGRPVAATSSGVIRRWIVEGAKGQLALQVLQRSGGAYVWGPRTPYENVTTTGIHVLAAQLALSAGDLVGLDVAPDTAIGLRGSIAGAKTARVLGPVSALTSARALRPGLDTGPPAELLLRVDYAPGARVAQPGLVTGRSAVSLPAGRRLAAQDVEPRPGQVRTVAVVVVGSTLALDLLAGQTRLARLRVTGADAKGQLLDLITFGQPSVRLRFRNPNGRLLEHTYDVGRASLAAAS
jgi:hypothetical protein